MGRGRHGWHCSAGRGTVDAVKEVGAESDEEIDRHSQKHRCPFAKQAKRDEPADRDPQDRAERVEAVKQAKVLAKKVLLLCEVSRQDRKRASHQRGGDNKGEE